MHYEPEDSGLVGPETATAADARAPEATTLRKGFALVTAILALVVVGAVLVGGHTAATSETLISESEQYSAMGLYAAERGLAEALAKTTRNILDTMAVNNSVVALSRNTGTTRYEVSVRRLSTNLYLFISNGWIPRGTRTTARRNVATLARVRGLDGDFNQAMLVYAGAELRGSVSVSGADSVPNNWTQCNNTGTTSGIVAKDSSTVDLYGAAQIIGTPPIEEDTTLSMDNFTVFGSLTFDDLVSYAKMGGKQYAAGSAETGATWSQQGGVCNTGLRSNWGAPTSPGHPCHFYFPLIYAAGNFQYGGNSIGQGILIVDGNLNLSGTAVFYGIVIVRGRLTVGSGNSQIIGTVLTSNGGEMENPNELSGNPTIRYSSCAIERAEKYNDFLGLAYPVKGRNWLDFSNASGLY